MNVLIACEESQRVCIEFRKLGHRAFSCDIQECSGGHPEWHILGDCLPLLNGNCEFKTEDGKVHAQDGRWDLIIAHPPCTYLTVSGNRHFNIERYGDKAIERIQKREEAIDFFMKFVNADCDKIAIENPIGVINTRYRKPDQIIEPYWFGHPYAKRTCLWLKNLPKLKPTNMVEPERIHSAGKSGGYSGTLWYVTDESGKILSWRDPRTKKERSKTFVGVAKAMAEQWQDNVSAFRMGELFCGPGGLAKGASLATISGSNLSIKHAWATDWDEDACKTYIKNICPDEPDSVTCADVRLIDFKDFSQVDALAFGFPCNDFSLMGERKGVNGDYGALYTHIIQALRFYHPKWFVAENVEGLMSLNSGNDINNIKHEMINAGYRIYPNLYKFEEYGLPQARHMVIIVGIRNDLPYEYRVPKPTMETTTCREAIENPPIPQDAKNNEPIALKSKTIERLKYILPGQNIFTADMPDDLRWNVKGAKISQLYKRLDPNKPAYTVIASDGGGTLMYHWDEPRALTNREKARLQTFPDDYVFVGNKTSVRKQIGMAVPPAGARIIFEAILKTFAGKEYESVDANM